MIKVGILNESFSKDNLQDHLKHIFDYKDDRRISSVINSILPGIKKFLNFYNNTADELQNAKARKYDGKQEGIVGYIQKNNGRYVKYNYDTGDFVIYAPDKKEHTSVSMYPISKEKFENQYNNNFGSELPENQEKENTSNEGTE